MNLRTGQGDNGGMNDILDRVLMLQKTEIFSQLSLDELGQIAHILEEEDFDEGEILFRKGDMGNTAYLMLSGKVEITLPQGRREEVLAVMEQGNFFGEMALLDGGTRSAGARCAVPARLYVLDRRDFLRVLNRYPSISLGIISIFSARLRKGNRQLSDLRKVLGDFGEVYKNNRSLMEDFYS